MEETKNVIQLMKLLKKASDEQENMSEKEKKDNAIKMGEIYYWGVIGFCLNEINSSQENLNTVYSLITP